MKRIDTFLQWRVDKLQALVHDPQKALTNITKVDLGKWKLVEKASTTLNS